MTASEMFEYCKNNRFFPDTLTDMDFKSFNIIESYLGDKKKTLVSFISYINEDERFAASLTDKELIFTQLTPVGLQLKTLNLEDILHLTVESGDIVDVIAIETPDQKLTFNVNKDSSSELYNKILKIVSITKEVTEHKPIKENIKKKRVRKIIPREVILDDSAKKQNIEENEDNIISLTLDNYYDNLEDNKKENNSSINKQEEVASQLYEKGIKLLNEFKKYSNDISFKKPEIVSNNQFSKISNKQKSNKDLENNLSKPKEALDLLKNNLNEENIKKKHSGSKENIIRTSDKPKDNKKSSVDINSSERQQKPVEEVKQEKFNIYGPLALSSLLIWVGAYLLSSYTIAVLFVTLGSIIFYFNNKLYPEIYNRTKIYIIIAVSLVTFALGFVLPASSYETSNTKSTEIVQTSPANTSDSFVSNREEVTDEVVETPDLDDEILEMPDLDEEIVSPASIPPEEPAVHNFEIGERIDYYDGTLSTIVNSINIQGNILTVNLDIENNRSEDIKMKDLLGIYAMQDSKLLPGEAYTDYDVSTGVMPIEVLFNLMDLTTPVNISVFPGEYGYEYDSSYTTMVITINPNDWTHSVEYMYE